MEMEQVAVRQLERLAEEFADVPIETVVGVVNDCADELDPVSCARHLLGRERDQRARRGT